MDAGELKVRLRADLAGWSKNLQLAQRQLRTFATGVATQMRRSAASIRHFAVVQMSRAYQSIKRYVRLIVLALAAIGVAAVKMATDVREANNFFRESFKSMTVEAKNWADVFGRRLYLNRQQVREYMVTFNEMLQGMGIGARQAMEMSKRFVTLTYDMASFRNLRLDESFRKITSAMVGMSRPLRDLGYDVSEAAIAEEALAQGITKSVENMSQAEKVMLRYYRMIRLLKNAHGDMERTLNEAANVFRGVWEQTIEIGQKVGEVLLKRIHKPAIELRDFLAANQSEIVVYFDTIITNLVNVANYIRSDFGDAVRVGGRVIIEIMGGVFDSIYAVAKNTFNKIGRDIPTWINEGLKAAVSAVTDVDLKSQALASYRAKTGDVQAGQRRRGLMRLSSSNTTGFAQPDVYLQELERLRMEAGKSLDDMTLRIQTMRQYVAQYPTDVAGQQQLQWLQRAALSGQSVVTGGNPLALGMELQDPKAISVIEERVRRAWAAGIKSAEQDESLSTELEAIWQQRMEKIAGVVREARDEGGLEIVTPDQIRTLHQAQGLLDIVREKLLNLKQRFFGGAITTAMDETIGRWKAMWLDASAAIAGAMQTAFSDIVADASKARDVVVNMLTEVQRAISDAIFRQYILQNVFKGLNMIPGVALQAPAAQAPTVQTGQFSGVHQLSKGGVVYAANGLFMPKGTDTVPAMLTPGEGVLDQDTTSRLRRILSVPTPAPQQTRPVNMNINAIDAQSTFAFFRKNRAAIATMLGLNKQVNHPATRS
jgi:hypothetical protein